MTESLRCRFHDSLPFILSLNHINPVRVFGSYFFNIHFNINHPSASSSSNWSLSFSLPHQNPDMHLPSPQYVAHEPTFN